MEKTWLNLSRGNRGHALYGDVRRFDESENAVDEVVRFFGKMTSC